MIKSYKDLIVWQKSLKLSLQVYKITTSFPREEVYGLTSQIRRCSVSIPSNIAEGYARSTRQEYARFLQIAFASGAELETQLLISRELKYLGKQEFENTNELLQENMKMLNVLIKKIRTNA